MKSIENREGVELPLSITSEIDHCRIVVVFHQRVTSLLLGKSTEPSNYDEERNPENDDASQVHARPRYPNNRLRRLQKLKVVWL
jgi:hypothetical protein